MATNELVRFYQKPNGVWAMEYLDDDSVRRRITTGIKTEQLRKPPAEVKAKVTEILFPLWEAARQKREPRQAAALTKAQK